VADEALIDRFRVGDPDAIRELYREFAGPVTTVARSIVQQPDLVADVVQQTFVKAWQAAGQFEGGRDLAPWLYAIARRTAIDAVRHESRPTRGDHDPETDVAVSGDTFEQTWIRFEVRRALDDLPADEREVVRRSHMLGETHSQIADVLGVPVGTVKSRSGRAYRRLARALAHLDANRSSSGDVQGEQAPS
jgi:RNA polymerase sigma-70 factor (ECF subfamily)